MSRRRRLLYAVLTILVYLLLLEGAARLVTSYAPGLAKNTLDSEFESFMNISGDPLLLWAMAPGTYQMRGTTAAINSYKLRGPQWSPDKPNGTRRILALGDSSIFGWEVKDDEVFTAVLDKELGPKVQAINGAMPGYSTEQSLLVLKTKGLMFKPDLVIISNMWSDCMISTFADKPLLARYKARESSFRRRLHKAAWSSALLQLVGQTVSRTLGSEPALQPRSSFTGPSQMWRVPLADYEQNIDTMVRLSRERGAQVLFLALVGRYFSAPGSGPAIYRKALIRAAHRAKAPLVDVSTLFQLSGKSKEELFFDGLHPSASGHKIIAQGIIAAIKPWLAGGALTP
jgi:lysophospholipase L1-like esterase